MGPLELSLAAAALLTGATGAFSPCGFSVVETLGPTGHTGGRRTTIAACIAFVPGAVLGGLLTFASLAALGELAHGAGGKIAYTAAAAIAVLAAVLEARGTRIVPQIRRQLPEHWRRVIPMPVAGALYGVLLGMGFTTFVLSFGVWALATISFAVGDPQIGLILGACFGIGRAIPVVILAPLAGTPAGGRATDYMALRPGVYLGMRRGDAAALAISSLALALSVGSAGAASQVVDSAADPSVSASDGGVVFERVNGEGALRQAGIDQKLPGSDPAIGSSYIAVREGDTIRLLNRASLEPIAEPIQAAGVDAIAVSGGWLVYRARASDTDRMVAREISSPAAPGAEIQLDVASDPDQLSPPSLDGSTLVYAVARTLGSRVVKYELPAGGKVTLLRSGKTQLFNPSVYGERFVYVASEEGSGKLMLRDVESKGEGTTLLKRRASEGGVLWSTALTATEVFVTILYPGATNPQAQIVSQSVDSASGGGGKKKGTKGKKGKKRKR